MTKKLYEAYRKIAIKAVQDTNIGIADNANVMVTEEGAFVEATVWVPRSEIMKPLEDFIALGRSD